MLDVTGGAEDALFWLGRHGIETEERRVVLPDAVYEMELLSADESVHWAADPDVPAAYISNDRSLFEDDDGVLLAGSGEIHPGERVEVPTFLFESDDSAEEAVTILPSGETAHFLTNPELRNAGVCMVAPEAVVRELFDARLGDGARTA
ncbi:hypothetical protein [Halopelagius longus]|uniref:Uncharacterized protein n=1 Tax=Halopelagius longus TaxID=1236180 RepID=A0A1H0Y684_9EURY|nr:hypothetical protein [Halopelagius longus]RDI72298.1 hypothetical protein DWB78_11570 [Halopelagius longus]SDQ10591.1 hypothetical protein SAMN05216278_0426 [Halopelagius longus]